MEQDKITIVIVYPSLNKSIMYILHNVYFKRIMQFQGYFLYHSRNSFILHSKFLYLKYLF